MPAEVQIDARLFHRRATGLVNYWKKANASDDTFQNVNSLFVLVGTADEDVNYHKSTALEIWLFGYELDQTLLVFTHDVLHIVTGAKKAKILETLRQSEGPQFPIEIHTRTKDEAQNTEIFKNIINIMDQQGSRVGFFAKDKPQGPIVSTWDSTLEASGKKFEMVDISSGMADVFAIKDDEELRATRMATKLSSLLMKNYFIEEMSSIIDEERTITHEKFTEQVEDALLNERMYKKLKFPVDAAAGNPEWCYTPIIQSGGEYDLKTSAYSNDKELHAGTIICSLGVRYKSYCSNIGRTFLIDPNKTQEKNYNFLLDVQRRVFDAMKEGVLIKDVYNRALDFIRSKRPELEKKFVKNVGFGTGIEFRESSYALNSKNNKELLRDMIFSVSVGFQDLDNPKAEDAKSKTYALLLVDTVKITENGAQVLTDCDTRWSEVSYFFKDADEEEEAPVKSEKAETRAAKSAVLNTKFRSEQDEASKDQARKEHQKLLADKKHEEGLKRYADGGGLKKDDQKSVWRKFESYKRESAMPKEVGNLRIVVDHKNDSIILPIYGFAVPFHISTLQKATKSDEGEFVYLRLNFMTPGQPGSKKDDTPFDDPNAEFVRALSFRSADSARMTQIYNEIQELKKNAVKKESERKEMADIVEQDKLIEVKGRRPPRLPDVFARPGLDGKRPGELEIHQNGLRYVSPLRNENRIDILFNNIKHLFFQPCDGELIVLLHCHLKNPIMIGKKKTEHVQFYREASDAQFDETGNRRRKYVYGDEDELASEQEERRRRVALNKEFKQFGEKITELSEHKVEIDIPYNGLAFNGVPFRTNVLLKPTQDCLVHLSEAPFLVVTLDDVEIVHLERIQFGLKNFDMVFVFKDYFQAPIHVNTIPMAQLDNVKEWLDSMDIVFYEGPVNLNWGPIMKTIQEDPAEFYKEGGWSFLAAESDAESGSEESGSEFEADESDYGSSSESSYYSDASMTGSEDEEEEDEESGEDWDVLEAKAKRADDKKFGSKREADSDSDNDRKKKRKR